MSRKVVDRDAYLAEQQATVEQWIADTERTTRQLRSALHDIVKEKQDRERSLLGALVQAAGLDEAGLKALLATPKGHNGVVGMTDGEAVAVTTLHDA